MDENSDDNIRATEVSESSAVLSSSSAECGDNKSKASESESLEGGLNTDGRHVGNWDSRYPEAAQKKICQDAWYVGAVLLLTLVLLLMVWNGSLFQLAAGTCATKCSSANFEKFALFYLGGLLGGILFGIKYFYKVVGRGMWNVDRRVWRIFSPFVSGGLALAVGAMVDSGLLGLSIKSTTPSTFLAMGFLTGYFADGALAKMQDVADTIFGSGRGASPPNDKNK